MVKPKAFLNHGKGRQSKTQALYTADDYQAVGVEHEEAAGKWRAGDAVKSMRFFSRAIEVYEEGLRRFPDSFDLAYNRARVQYEVATHPVLVCQLSIPVMTALRTSLDSHRYALNLEPQNADLLFNMAQVLTSVAEESAKDERMTDADRLKLLEQALDLQNQCLAIQELEYEQSQEQEEMAKRLTSDSLEEDQSDQAKVPSETFDSSSASSEQWASVLEPVTMDTLIDTVLAQLGTLTTLCDVLATSPDVVSGASLASVEEYSSKLLMSKLPSFALRLPDRLQEIALAKANFISSALEAGYRTGKIDAETYQRERDAAFKTPDLKIEAFPTGMIANATSLICYSSALAERRISDVEKSLAMRWIALSSAISNLTIVSKMSLASLEEVWMTHRLRGDCSLSQHQMSKPPAIYPQAVSNAERLLRNAEIFYKNAIILAANTNDKDIASFRHKIVVALQVDDLSNSLSQITSGSDLAWVEEQIQDMITDTLLPHDFRG